MSLSEFRSETTLAMRRFSYSIPIAKLGWRAANGRAFLGWQGRQKKIRGRLAKTSVCTWGSVIPATINGLRVTSGKSLELAAKLRPCGCSIGRGPTLLPRSGSKTWSGFPHPVFGFRIPMFPWLATVGRMRGRSFIPLARPLVKTA